MKRNYLKIIIVIGFGIISLSIANYFLIYLPKLNSEQISFTHSQQILANKQKCIEAGEKLYNANKADSYGDSIYNARENGSPSYSYNSKLNTCLYEDEWQEFLPGNVTLFNVMVTDSLTNSDVYSFTWEPSYDSQCQRKNPGYYCMNDSQFSYNTSQVNNLMPGTFPN